MTNEILNFIEYVYGFYGKNGIYASELNQGKGFSLAEIYYACIEYKNENEGVWGGGDSTDREGVRKILEPDYDPVI